MFGELLGLWAAEVWASMGSPSPVHLVELGPGRGTLMSDALRAARIVPEFRAALDVWLVETSPTLAAMQHEICSTAASPVAWAQKLGEVPAGPAIVIANEFLDALPMRQFVRVGGQWRERAVRLDGEGNLAFDVAAEPEPYSRPMRANGEILEVNPSGHRFMFELGARLVKEGGAALLIDYGHSSPGSATRCRPCALTATSTRSPRRGIATSPPMSISPPWRAARSAAGAAVYGPIDQGDFCARSASTSGPRRLRTRRTAEQAEELETHPRPPRRQGQGRNGRAVQGRWPWRTAGCRPRPVFTRLRQAGVNRRHSFPRSRPQLPGVAHAFFTRRGGVSDGVYASLNGGVGSRDAPRPSPRTAPGWPPRSAFVPSASRCPSRSIRPTRSRSPITGRPTRGRAATQW